MYINFSSNSIRYKVRLTRKQRLKRVQIDNLIIINEVVNVKNASPRLQGDGFSEYLVVSGCKYRSNEGSIPESPLLKSKYIIN